MSRELFANDAEQKLFQCLLTFVIAQRKAMFPKFSAPLDQGPSTGRDWCPELAVIGRGDSTAGGLHSIVSENVGYLLEGTRHPDESVFQAAHHVLLCYSYDGLPVLQQRISESMLDRLENLRQKWASLSVEVLAGMQPAPAGIHKVLLCDLMQLWQVDASPQQTFAEAKRQLLALSGSRMLRDRAVTAQYNALLALR